MELKTLCELFGPSGFEGPVRRAIVEEAQKYCADVRVDKMGNVIAFQKGTRADGGHVAVAAHMDEIGFIVYGHTEEGMLRFRPVGGIDSRVVVSKWVVSDPGTGGVKGVIGAKAIHLQSAADRQKVLDYDSLYIDIGAKDRQEAEGLCPLGTYFAFDGEFTTFGEGFAVSKALDDRVGCHTMLRLMQNKYPVDVSYCFVTGEEVGLRGSQGAAYRVKAPVALVLEGTAANDLGDVKPQAQVANPGKGVAVSFMDGASIADRGLFKKMLELGEKEKIAYQVKRACTGGNDAGSFQRSGAGAKTVVLSVPCRYIHSASNVCALSDVEAQYSLADAFLRQEQ